MLAESPEPHAEEFAIHDHEGFGGLAVHEYADIEQVARWAGLLAEHGAAFAAYANNVGPEYAEEEGFQDAYLGEWECERAYAEQLFDELYLHEVPEHLRPYIDYDAFARDLFLGDCYAVPSDAGVFVFRHG